MHELAICQAILAQVSAVARAQRVALITLSIGPLAGIEPYFLRAAFPLAAAGTCCAGARLVIQTSVVRVECHGCGAESGAKPNRLVCASCGDWRVALLTGDEMRIESLELSEEETANV